MRMSIPRLFSSLAGIRINKIRKHEVPPPCVQVEIIQPFRMLNRVFAAHARHLFILRRTARFLLHCTI